DYAIIDEAHHLEKVATDLLGDALSQYSLSRFLGRLYRRRQRASSGVLAKVVNLTSQWLLEDRQPNRAEQVLSLIEHNVYPLLAQFEEAVQSCFDAAQLWLGDRSTRRISGEGDWHTQVGKRLFALEGLLTELNKHLRRLISDVAPVLEDEPGVRTELEALAQRGAVLAQLADRLAHAQGDGEVFWVERQRARVRVLAASLDVAPAMEEWMNHLSAAVLTSATLTIDRSFDYMRSRLGLSEVECKEHIIPSPFNYKDQVLIAVPKDIPDPNDPRYPQALSAACARFVEASGGRALLLFTSYAMLRYVARALEPVSEREGWPLLVQGEQNRSFMLNAFRDRPSVLLGTDSFWEGVDVPGKALSCLIIAKLPFFVPDEPIVEARLELLRQRGYDPFYNYSLPDAILKFKQGFGRLIRTGSDRGVVVICDRRIVTRNYGQVFWASLPECGSYQGTVEEVASAIREWL
ncbi:MAG: ATP-dependent DNA helicase, partial [Limnochordia bacterium]